MTGPAHRVTDDEYVLSLSPEQRAEHAQAAVDAIVSLAPNEMQENVRMFLSDSRHWAGLSGSDDPEVTKLLSVLSTIANAEIREWKRGTAPDRHKKRNDGDPSSH